MFVMYQNTVGIVSNFFALVLLYSGIIASEICGSQVLVLARITPKRGLKNAE